VNRKLILSFTVLLVLALGLAACSATPATPPAPTAAPTSLSGGNPTSASAVETGANLVHTDSQGAVEFAVTPLNLTTPGETLDFDVSMNTHSVDVSWDLAAQSVLKTDMGLEVKGLSWPIGAGHHYEGTLTFPAKTADGKALLDGATTLSLVIRDADAPERVFVWDLSQ